MHLSLNYLLLLSCLLLPNNLIEAFRKTTTAKVYLGPCQTSVMEICCKNSERRKAVKYYKPLTIFEKKIDHRWRVVNTPMF